MAATTNRTVELTIKLQGVQTLEQLEQVTSEINADLKQIDVNSQAFVEMAALAQKANTQAKELDVTLQGITSGEKAEAVNKMGMALVGAFQAAAGASLLFGEQTSKELEKVIAKVGGLFAITDGLKKITEAFSEKNITALKSVVKGWQESAIAAKLFGTTTRAAITATGIGILIVALGTIVANWDTIKVSIAKAFDKLKEWIPGLKVVSEVIEYIVEKVGSLEALFAGIGAAIDAAFSGENIANAFDAAVKGTNDLIAAQTALLSLEENVGKFLDANIEKERLAGETRINQLKLNNASETKIQKERYQNQLNLIIAEERYYSQLRAFQQEAIDAKRRLNEEATKEELEALEQTKIKTENLFLEIRKASQENSLRIQEIDKNNYRKYQENLDAKKKLNDELLQYTMEGLTKELYLLDKFYEEQQAKIKKIGGISNELQQAFEEKFQEERLATIRKYEIKIQAIRKKFAQVSLGDNKDLSKQIIANLKAMVGTVDKLTFGQKFRDFLIENEEALIELAYVSVDVMNGVFNVIDAQNQAKIDAIEKEKEAFIKANEEKLKKQLESIDANSKKEVDKFNAVADEKKKIQDDYNSSIDELNQELADAEGERYTDILNQIAIEEKAKLDAHNAEIKAINDAKDAEKKALDEKTKAQKEYDDKLAAIEARKYQAEKKAAEARKKQAIADAIMQTGLVILNAARTNPFIPLGLIAVAAATVLGALQVATISKTPTGYALGGYTPSSASDGQPVGTVHANEWVAPAYMVRDPRTSAMIQTLESMRTNGFAQGGYTSIAPNTTIPSLGIDYKQIGVEVAMALKANPAFVSVTEIRDVSNRLRVVENRASI